MSIEVQPARALSDSRIHLPSGASFTLHYPVLHPISPHFVSNFNIDLPKILYAAGFSILCKCLSACLSSVPFSWGDKHPSIYPALQWDQCSPQTLSEGMPCSAGGRWCACLGTACPQLLAEELCTSREASDGWWPCVPSPPSPPPLLLSACSEEAAPRDSAEYLTQVPRVKCYLVLLDEKHC